MDHLSDLRSDYYIHL